MRPAQRPDVAWAVVPSRAPGRYVIRVARSLAADQTSLSLDPIQVLAIFDSGWFREHSLSHVTQET